VLSALGLAAFAAAPASAQVELPDPIRASGAPIVPDPAPASVVFDGDAMWIWLLERSDRGDLGRVVRRARRNGLELVILKAGDARAQWTQVSPELVGSLHAAGIRVCGYHFVYGEAPRAEARVSAAIARTGADCLVIDAEGTYEGRYRQAEVYMRALRRRIGPDYPVGLTSFPYVHYHPSFPYSVFLGPGGADFNVPQIYWRAIGHSVGRATRTTYMHNRVYARPIYPLGQVWQHPPRWQIARFRALTHALGATGVSWWSWQEAQLRDWRAVRGPLRPLRHRPADPGYPLLGSRSRGDLVVRAQQLLLGSGARLRVTARMDRRTRRAVTRLQAAAGLPVTGLVDAATWEALLAHEPAAITWRRRGLGVRRAVAGDEVVAAVPPRVPSRGDELRRRPGG